MHKFYRLSVVLFTATFLFWQSGAFVRGAQVAPVQCEGLAANIREVAENCATINGKHICYSSDVLIGLPFTPHFSTPNDRVSLRVFDEVFSVDTAGIAIVNLSETNSQETLFGTLIGPVTAELEEGEILCLRAGEDVPACQNAPPGLVVHSTAGKSGAVDIGPTNIVVTGKAYIIADLTGDLTVVNLNGEVRVTTAQYTVSIPENFAASGIEGACRGVPSSGIIGPPIIELSPLQPLDDSTSSVDEDDAQSPTPTEPATPTEPPKPPTEEPPKSTATEPPKPTATEPAASPTPSPITGTPTLTTTLTATATPTPTPTATALPLSCNQTIELGETIEIQNNAPGQVCLLAFCASANEAVTIEMTALDDNLDPWLELRGLDDRTIKYNDDISQDNRNSLICHQPLPEDGCYTIAARSYRYESFGSFSLSLGGSETECEMPEMRCDVIARRGLNLRANPSLDAPIINTLPRGEFLEPVAMDTSGDWIQVVNRTGESGWVTSADELLMCDDVEWIPTVTPTPTPTITPTPTSTSPPPRATPTPRKPGRFTSPARSSSS